MENQVYKPTVYERLDALNDELHIVRRLLNRPEAFRSSEIMDVLRMAVDYTHHRYQELAFELRQEASRDKA